MRKTSLSEYVRNFLREMRDFIAMIILAASADGEYFWPQIRYVTLTLE